MEIEKELINQYLNSLNENSLATPQETQNNEFGYHENLILPEQKDKEENTPAKARRKREEAKLKRCHGESYLGFRRLDKKKTNKISQDVQKSAVTIGPPCTSKLCERAINARFCSSIAETDRIWLFHQFWSLPDWEEKKKYIASLIDVKKPKQRTKKDIKSRRENSFVYHLKIGDKNVAVCKQLFENTFGLKWSTIRNWIKKYKEPNIQHQETISPAELVTISLDLSDEEDTANIKKRKFDLKNAVAALTKFGRMQSNEDFKFCQFMYHEMQNLSSEVKRDLQKCMQRALKEAIDRELKSRPNDIPIL